MEFDYGMIRETMKSLDDFSAHVENLRHSMGVLHSLVWAAMEGDEKAGEQAAHLSETLLEISQLVSQIKAVE